MSAAPVRPVISAGRHTAAQRLRRWWAGSALLLASLPALAFDLPALMAMLGRSRDAEFSEQRFVKGLDQPLSASGTLSFIAPDRFVRKTLLPRAETMAVEGNSVTLTRGGRSRNFALDAVPDMVGMIEALRGTLTGNAQTLQRYFKVDASGSAEQWSLLLTPLEAGLAAQLRSIRMAGRRADLQSIEMQLADGDRSLMTITPLPVEPAAGLPSRRGASTPAGP